ncbi:hypothetical protein TBR22_A27490 [Luteitalea sp. TBR-22]|uniref:GspE/PulE/PilB domain-containing protein n=1 Tax=Luteitalea sp. TBR-22 TaxID=2802971 RepID=UPI001AFB3821|nr:hypothetical protein [Luteitalea sp. TBR-22]BCS33522.1 hypothetical protein TBR22_A27490 [Luteitalea sp. TBR-22]
MARCAHEQCRTWRVALWLRRGLTFDGEWFCSPGCLADATARRLEALRPPVIARVPTMPPVRLGTTLVASRSITAETLERALGGQASSGLRLGAQLLAMGAVDEPTITHALARQSGVGFLTSVNPTSVRKPVANLSRTVVHALGVVPLELERDGTLRIAVGAPLPRMAIAALQSGTGLRVRPYLVSDAVLRALLEAYGTDAAPARPSGVGRLSAAQAARRIADAALAGRAVSWQHTWGPGFAWVRLDGASGPEDLIVAPSVTEQTWQVALTQR